MPLPVISVAQMREWEERTWAAGTSVESVMQQAGEAVAAHIQTFALPDGPILFLIGQGNNGGDARLAAEALDKEWQTQILEVKDGTEPLPDIAGVKLVVDGLFGIGLNRDLSSDWCDFIQQLNRATQAHRIPVVSVDVPSGLDADTGLARGAAVRADYTLTFGAPKIGLVMEQSAEFVGHLNVAPDIGLGEAPAPEELRWISETDFDRFIPKRNANAHKGSFGHVGIIAGSTGYHGAAVLAAKAAECSAVGLVSVFTPAYAPVAAQLQSAMVHPWDENVIHTLSACNAVVVGPGLAGPDVPASLQQVVINLWRGSGNPIVVDASALDWIVNEPVPESAVRVVTPHPGEAARMLESAAGKVQGNRLLALRAVSATCSGALAVLKGRHTLIGQASGPVQISGAGTPRLAQAGSGDVLAGYLGGWLARRDLQQRTEAITAMAVWRHGRAAENLSLYPDHWGMDSLISTLGRIFDC